MSEAQSINTFAEQRNIHPTAKIHPTSIVETGAKIAAGVEIGPYCTISKNVELAENVKLVSHVVVDGDTYIGEGTQVFPFATIGLISQDMKFFRSNEVTGTRIGKNNIIREHVTIHAGTPASSATVIGDNNLFMVGVHVAHDCQVGNNIYIANNTPLAGEVVVEDFAIIGGNSAVLQFVHIGRNAMVGGMTAVSQDVLPYSLVSGARPATWEGLNLVGLKRKGFNLDEIKTIQKAYNMLFDESHGTYKERIEQIKTEFGHSKQVQELLTFIDTGSKHGFIKPAKK